MQSPRDTGSGRRQGFPLAHLELGVARIVYETGFPDLEDPSDTYQWPGLRYAVHGCAKTPLDLCPEILRTQCASRDAVWVNVNERLSP